MQCKIQIDPLFEEPYAVIHTSAVTQEVKEAAAMLEKSAQKIIHGYLDGNLYFLPQSQLLRVYAEKQKVYAQTPKGIFSLHMRLYEAEQQLDPTVFLRISNAELVNSKCIQKLDVSLAGTIGVFLEGGVRTYASRRYVPKIKTFFGLRREAKR